MPIQGCQSTTTGTNLSFLVWDALSPIYEVHSNSAVQLWIESCLNSILIFVAWHSLFVQKIWACVWIIIPTAASFRSYSLKVIFRSERKWLRMGHFLLLGIFLLPFSPWVVPLMLRPLNGSVYRLIKIQFFCLLTEIVCARACKFACVSVRVDECKCMLLCEFEWMSTCMWTGVFERT